MELGTLRPGRCWDMSKHTLQSLKGQEAPSQQTLEIQIHQQLTKQLDSKPGKGRVLQHKSVGTVSLLWYQLISLFLKVFLTIPAMKLQAQLLRQPQTLLSTGTCSWVQ